jgi:hypothetical protein
LNLVKIFLKEYIMRTNTKINRHEKVACVLLSGKPISPADIEACFKGTDQEGVLYRLSTNIYNIRKDGGIVRVHKDGRKVTAYQLVNFDEFSPEGRYIGKQKAVAPVETVKEVAETV